MVAQIRGIPDQIDKVAGWGGFMLFSSFSGVVLRAFWFVMGLLVLLHYMQEIVGDIHLEVIDIHPGLIQLDHQMTHGWARPVIRAFQVCISHIPGGPAC